MGFDGRAFSLTVRDAELLDGKPVAVAGEVNPIGVSNLDWPSDGKGQTEALRVSDGQLDDLRVSAAAIFAKELQAAEIERLFAAGSAWR